MIDAGYLLDQPGSGYSDNMTTRFPTQSHFPNHMSSFPQHDQLVNHPNQIQSAAYNNNNNNRVGLALGPPQSSPSFQAGNSSLQQPNLNPFDHWSNNQEKGVVDDFLSEEEIRMRSHEMLENEDMQHLLRLFSMGNHASVNVPEEGFGFPSYMTPSSPGLSYNEDRTRSGKAVVGWLKIKAAMRWGIFIRKKAAERRAQIVELDDEENSF